MDTIPTTVIGIVSVAGATRTGAGITASHSGQWPSSVKEPLPDAWA
ncbi:MAG: hypothetical protein IPG10_16855 [Flavobacteriales bacterium]|nr:hypothetical protein [Flavobacteriales bacterium]